MSRLRAARFTGVLGVGLGLALASACSAGNKGGGSSLTRSGTGSGATGSGGSGIGVGSGNGSGAGTVGNINTNNNNSGGSDGGACQKKELKFTPKTPTVFVLVDRSGSMFDMPNPPWEPLKMGALQVIQELQNDVAFGWGAFTGLAGTTCPDFKSVPPAKGNYDAINAVYGTLGATGYKSETPVGLALPLVEQLLSQSPVDGDKYILFVTDGEPDFCDDGEANCPIDDVVYRLQGLSAKGIQTIIFGLQSGKVPPATLQAFANAGAAAPVALPFAQSGSTTSESAMQVFYDCQGVTGWKTDWTAAGKTGMDTLGTYSATGATTKYYQPDPADQGALTTQLRTVLSGVKSCTFDLSDFTVDLTQLNLATVSVQGQVVPLDMTNGWWMNTTSQLQLVGDACTNWKQPQITTIDFDFPCEILVHVK